VHLVNRGDSSGNLPARLAFEASAEERVDDEIHAFGGDVRDIHRIDCCLLPGNRLRTLRRHHFDHSDFGSFTREATSDNPTVAAVVSRTGENDHSVAELLRIAVRDLISRACARALHQHLGGNAAINCRSIALG
jgi:hypothetical protein